MNERTVAAVYPDQSTEIAATVWYNNQVYKASTALLYILMVITPLPPLHPQPYHMPAAALNAFHNILLKKLSPSQSFSISVNNHPLPRNLTVQVNYLFYS